MRISDFKKPALSGIVFFGTVVALSVGYAAYSSLPPVSGGQALMASSWNQMKENLDDLHSRVSSISESGWKVGISKDTEINRYLFISTDYNGAGLLIRPKDSTGAYTNTADERNINFTTTGIGWEDATLWYKFTWRKADGSLRKDAIILQKDGHVYFPGGNVGIWTITPQKKLDVSGDIAISSNKYLWSSPNSGTNVGQIKLHDSTTGNMEFTKIWGGNFVFSGWNVVMWYEIITNDIASGAVAGWYYASCPSGKVVLGGSCSTGAGTQPTNTSISGNGYGCYKSNTTTNWQIKATCANMQ